MNDYVIMTDSSCDMPAELAEELGLEVVPLSVRAGEKEYVNYLDGREIAFPEFYNLLRKGVPVQTSAPNVEQFEKVMRKILESGRDVLYIAFSSGLSATHGSGAAAAELLKGEYPDRKIFVVDSLCASLGEGLLVYLTAEKKRAGATVEEAAKFAEDTKMHICHWFSVSDLKHLHRGGRVSKTVAIVGSVLNIKPVMHVDNAGGLALVSKARGKKSMFKVFVDKARETGYDIKNQTMFISHGDCIEDARELAAMLKEQLGVKDVIINYVGPVIGAHSGPGTLAMFFVGDCR